MNDSLFKRFFFYCSVFFGSNVFKSLTVSSFCIDSQVTRKRESKQVVSVDDEALQID